jgi:hypothetical protein
MALYAWAGQMASSLFELVAHLEVMVRNAMDDALADHFDDAGCGIPWFLRTPPATAEIGDAVERVRDRLRQQNRDTRHQIIAGLTFGFWSGMLGRKHEELWRSALRHAFPRSDGTRKQVGVELEAIRKLRNRLAHHDSILHVDIPFEVHRIHRVASFLGEDAATWLETVDRTGATYRQRPHTRMDTAIVPARDAWPLYLNGFAYVCQAGRAFRPVDYLAFYLNQQIQVEIPRIKHRRDDVLWNAQEAQRLAASSDRNDRKISTIILATLAENDANGHPWSEGAYQVFLLSRPGDNDHRTLQSPILHTKTGRGSAFVRRHRYVSLHSLQTSSITDEISVVLSSDPSDR